MIVDANVILRAFFSEEAQAHLTGIINGPL